MFTLVHVFPPVFFAVSGSVSSTFIQLPMCHKRCFWILLWRSHCPHVILKNSQLVTQLCFTSDIYKYCSSSGTCAVKKNTLLRAPFSYRNQQMGVQYVTALMSHEAPVEPDCVKMWERPAKMCTWEDLCDLTWLLRVAAWKHMQPASSFAPMAFSRCTTFVWEATQNAELKYWDVFGVYCPLQTN